MKQNKLFGFGILLFSLFAILLFSGNAKAAFYENQTLTFFTYYNNNTSPYDPILPFQGNCSIVFSDNTSNSINMTYNETNVRYEYKKSFAYNGTYRYNTTCLSDIFPSQTNSSEVYIQLRPLSAPSLQYISTVTNQNSYNVIGFTNKSGVNVSVYRNDSSTINSSVITLSVNVLGNSNVVLDASAEDSTVYVTDGMTGLFQVGRYLIFDGHNRTNFLGYYISAVNPTEDPEHDIITISPALESSVASGEVIWVRDSIYPVGWFNISLNLLPGYNYIQSSYKETRLINTLNEAYNVTPVLGTITSNKSETIVVVLENQLPWVNVSFSNLINNLTPTIYFNVSDDYKLNITSLLLNVTNGTTITYYAYDSNVFLGLGTFGNNITCEGDELFQNCYVQVSLTEGRYNFTFYINDSVGNLNTTKLTNITVDVSISSILSVIDEGITTWNSSIFFNWTPITDSSGVNRYEYLLWVYYYNASTTRINVTGWNSTNSTNVTISRNYVIDGKYFLDVRAVDNAGNTGNSTSSDGIFYVDVSAPVCDNCIFDEGTWTNDMNLFGYWTFSENESTIMEYIYWVGNNTCFMSGYDSLKGETHTSISNATFVASSLDNNASYYFSVIARNNEQIRNSTSNCYSSNGIKFDNIPPTNGNLLYFGGNLTTTTIQLFLGKGVDNLSGISRAEIYQAKTSINTMTGACGFFAFNLLTEIDVDLTNYPVSTEDGYCYRFQYRIYDNAGNFFTYSSNQSVNDSVVDSTPPSGVTVTDAGTMTNSRQLYASWTAASDPNSGIAYYLYTIGSTPNSSNLLGGQWRVTTQTDATEYNLSMNDSVTYYFTVVAVNHVGLQGPESYSDGITFFDITAPLPVEIIQVGNDSSASDGYYDGTASTNTTILIKGEPSMTCVFSLYDIPYTDYPDNNNLTLGICSNTVSDYTNCTINNITEGNWTYYIICKDEYGNTQDQNHNTEVSFVKDYSAPIITINSPNATNVGGLVLINVTITDVSVLNYSRYVIYNNSPESTYITQNITQGDLANGLDTWVATSFVNSTNLTIAVEVKDSSGYISFAYANFTLDNTIPYIIVNAPNYINNNFTINFTLSLFTNFTYIITYSGTLKQNASNYSDQGSVVYFSQDVVIDNATYWPDGVYNITAYALRNNSKNTTATSGFVIDRVAPRFEFEDSFGPYSPYNNGFAYFSIDIVENITLSNVILQLNISNSLINYTVTNFTNEFNIYTQDLFVNDSFDYYGYNITLLNITSNKAYVNVNGTIGNVSYFYYYYEPKIINNVLIALYDLDDYANDSWDSATLLIGGNYSVFDYIINVNFSLLNLSPTQVIDHRWFANDSAGNSNYSEFGGYLVYIRNRVPSFSTIPDQSFKSNESLLLNLTPYIINLDNDNLSITYVVSDNNVLVSINNITKIANISTLSNWYGTPNIILNVSDPYNASNISNQIILLINLSTNEPYCGDGTCNNGETCNSCSGDCGTCPSSGGGGGGGGSYGLNRVIKPNCTDGIQNQKETGIDCGGPCQECYIAPPIIRETCNDGIRNQAEEGIDCGGPCTACIVEQPIALPVETCYDFVQNQAEEGIDCGGPCNACPEIIEEKPFSFGWIGWLLGLLILLPLFIFLFLFLYKRRYKEEKPQTVVLQEAETVRLKPVTETEYQAHKEDIFDLPEFQIKKDTEQGKLYGYVKNKLKEGKSRMDIRRELMVEGWSEKQINKVLKMITYHERLSELEEYVAYCYNNGYTKDEVRKNLLAASWSEEIVDLVIHEVHNIHDDLDKVKSYVRHRIGLGHSMDEIRETLLRIGWDHKVIEPLLDYGVYALKDEYDFDRLDD